MSKLQELRKAAGISQSELAKASGISVRTIQNYEQGELDINGISILRADGLARALGVSIEDLIERDEDGKGNNHKAHEQV